MSVRVRAWLLQLQRLRCEALLWEAARINQRVRGFNAAVVDSVTTQRLSNSKTIQVSNLMCHESPRSRQAVRRRFGVAREDGREKVAKRRSRKKLSRSGSEVVRVKSKAGVLCNPGS